MTSLVADDLSCFKCATSQVHPETEVFWPVKSISLPSLSQSYASVHLQIFLYMHNSRNTKFSSMPKFNLSVFYATGDLNGHYFEDTLS